MMMAISSVLACRLEKAATDNGFDREIPPNGNWLHFASSQCSLQIWLGSTSAQGFVAAFSKRNVAAALAEYGQEWDDALPPEAASGRTAQDIPGLHQLLRRAFQLGKSLPDELLHIFNAATKLLPRSTEAERLVVQRVGQDIFRQGLMDYWEGRCAITGLAVPELLRASHIKPWAACETDAERLDVFNGFLLAPHLDAAFDQGFITISDEGEVIASPRLHERDQAILGITSFGGVRIPITNHRGYLAWHRQNTFRQQDETEMPESSGT